MRRSLEGELPEGSLPDELPHFDLSVLTPKQYAVVEMRYAGRLSWRKMAALEGVTHQSLWERHTLALRKLREQIPPP